MLTVQYSLQYAKEDSGKFLNIHEKGWEKADGPNQYDGLNPPW